MEKVLDSGVQIPLPNIEHKVQSQVFSTLDELENDHTNKSKKEIQEKYEVSDYYTFMKKSKSSQNKLFPSIFTSLSIKQQDLNISKDFKAMQNSSFPLLGMKNKDLIQFSCRIISNDKIMHFYSQKDLKKLIKCISNGYNVISYHTFTHAVSLMHLLQDCFRKDTNLRDIFSPEERSFCLLAALAHDINHPGTNNSYENKVNTKWSKLAENDSTLQKMHIRYFFGILRKQKNFNIENNSQNPLLIKELMTRAILSTDITKHFTNLEKLKTLIQTKRFCKDNYNHRYVHFCDKKFLMENLFHACDIGNPCLPYGEYLNWAILVSYQFNYQSELETKQNLQVSPYFRYEGKKNFYSGQSNFIKLFTYPLWKQLSQSWPGLSPFIKNISINLSKLKLFQNKESLQNQSQFFIEIK